MATGSPRIHPSCQPPTESLFSWSEDSITAQLPFNCEVARKQLPEAALKASEEEMQKAISLAAA